MNEFLRQYWTAAVAALAGLLLPFTVNVVGAVPLAEVVLIALVGLLVVSVATTHQLSAPLMRSRLFWCLLIAQGIALLAYIGTDLYRESDVRDIARGWSRLAFLAIDFIAVAWLFGAARANCLWMLAGSVVGSVVAAMLARGELNDPWKFGYGGAVTLAVMLLAPRFGSWFSVLALGSLGLVNLALDYRSLGGICLLGSALLALQMFPRAWRLPLFVPACVVGVVAVGWFYSSREDVERGSRSDVERGAMVAATWDGFRGSPLVGQGSWFSKSDVFDRFLERRWEAAQIAKVGGYSQTELQENIAIHSQILVALAEGGIFGGTFFILYGVLLGLALLYCVVGREPDVFAPVFVLQLLVAIWNLLASPFSGAHRVIIAINCGIILLLWQEWRSARRPAPAPVPPRPEFPSAVSVSSCL